jgi:hypothetical protein
VADHPLRPATDRRLGRPLPHQLPNPTRAPPTANLFRPQAVYGISRSFPRLSRTAGQVPTRYSPVRHSLANQGVRLACVRHAASVRSEPGSNSHVHPLPRLNTQEKVTRNLGPSHIWSHLQDEMRHLHDRPYAQPQSLSPEARRPGPPPAHPFLVLSTCQTTDLRPARRPAARGSREPRSAPTASNEGTRLIRPSRNARQPSSSKG